MLAVVTGAAGFMGSHLCDRLLQTGHDVVGIDSFSDFYSRRRKEANIAWAARQERFSLHQIDLAEADVRPALQGADVVFHLAGRCGLGTFAPEDFGRHLHDNVVATQRLLEATAATRVGSFVYAGSSSVYGDVRWHPTKESVTPVPLSSYGVSKLAGENLVRLYAARTGLVATTLRYFTVYGPRQRPDMAISRFIQALASGDTIEVVGDGGQTRDFTYVDDAIDATIRAAAKEAAGQTINIGGGSHCSVNEILDVLEDLTGMQARRVYLDTSKPEPRHAAASINAARRCLGWEPRTSLRQGLARQWTWFQEQSGHTVDIAV